MQAYTCIKHIRAYICAVSCILRSYHSTHSLSHTHAHTHTRARTHTQVRLVKAWASSREINSAQHGFFNSFGSVYIHPYMHTYSHTYRQTHTYLHTSVHTYIHTYRLSLLVLHYLQNLEIPILPRLNLRDDEWDAWDQDWEVPPPPLPPGIQGTCEGIEIR